MKSVGCWVAERRRRRLNPMSTERSGHAALLRNSDRAHPLLVAEQRLPGHEKCAPPPPRAARGPHACACGFLKRYGTPHASIWADRLPPPMPPAVAASRLLELLGNASPHRCLPIDCAQTSEWGPGANKKASEKIWVPRGSRKSAPAPPLAPRGPRQAGSALWSFLLEFVS